MESKSPLKSRTLWINLIVAVAAFIPSVKDFVAANPDILLWGFSALNVVLRIITKKQVDIIS